MHPVLNLVWRMNNGTIVVIPSTLSKLDCITGWKKVLEYPSNYDPLVLFSTTDTIRDKITINLLVHNLSYNATAKHTQNINANEYFNLVSSFVHPPSRDFSLLKTTWNSQLTSNRATFMR